MALAGDPQAAVAALEQSVRAGKANAKTRQNLALSYALGGRWLDARATAALDLPTDLVDKRIIEWAALARPANAWEQVASILGVSPRMDRGQPEALALNDVAGQQYAAAQPAPVAAPEPKAVEIAAAPEEPAPNYEIPAEVKDPAPVRMAQADTPVEAAPIAPAPAFSAKQQIVPVAIPASAPVATPHPARAAGEGSRYVVQLGAFSSAGVAADGWNRATRRFDFLKAYDGRQAKVSLSKGTFYRLSFSGFASRDDANRTCARIKSNGGNCFVRAMDGADSIRWASNSTKRGQQLASR
jgi:cell division septation protein DedD